MFQKQPEGCVAEVILLVTDFEFEFGSGQALSRQRICIGKTLLRDTCRSGTLFYLLMRNIEYRGLDVLHTSFGKRAPLSNPEPPLESFAECSFAKSDLTGRKPADFCPNAVREALILKTFPCDDKGRDEGSARAQERRRRGGG